jgi:putative colanic acid biosynthesis UDP-glucose lipid carrier transferase
MTKGDSRNVVRVQSGSNSTKKTFESRDDYGYHFFGYFSDKQENIEIKGKLEN